MSTRVDAEEIKEIIETSLSDPTIEAFIGAANIIITNSLGSSTLTAAHLKEIERWLTAHFIASSRERQTTSESVGQAKVEYNSKVGLGLDGTTYGQQVKMLDTTGILANLGAGKREASIFAVTSFTDEDTI
jgi:hypothetical protein